MFRLTFAALLFFSLPPVSWSQEFDGKDQIHLRDLLEIESFFYTSGVDYMGGYRNGQFSDAEIQKFVSKGYKDLESNVIWRLNYVLPKLASEPEILAGQIEHCFKLPRGTEFEIQRAKTEILKWLAAQEPEASDRDLAYFLSTRAAPKYDFESKAFAFETQTVAWGDTDFVQLLPREQPLRAVNVLSSPWDLRREYQLFLGNEKVDGGSVEWKIAPKVDPEEVAKRIAAREKPLLLIEGSRSGATFSKRSSEGLGRGNEFKPNHAVDVRKVSLWLYNNKAATIQRVSESLPLNEAIPALKTVAVEDSSFLEYNQFLYKEGDFAPRPVKQPDAELASEAFPKLPEQIGLMRVLEDKRTRIAEGFFRRQRAPFGEDFFNENPPEFVESILTKTSSLLVSNQTSDFPWYYDVSSTFVEPRSKGKAMEDAIAACFEIRRRTELEAAKRAEVDSWMKEIGHNPPLGEQWILVGFEIDEYDSDRKAFKAKGFFTDLEQANDSYLFVPTANRILDKEYTEQSLAGADYWPFLDDPKIITTWKLILNGQLHNGVRFYLPFDEAAAPAFDDKFGYRPKEGLFLLLQGKPEGVYSSPAHNRMMIHGGLMKLAFKVHRLSAWSLNSKGLIATKIADDLDPDAVFIKSGDGYDYSPLPGEFRAEEKAPKPEIPTEEREWTFKGRTMKAAFLAFEGEDSIRVQSGDFVLILKIDLLSEADREFLGK